MVRSFLVGRKQRVIVNGEQSELTEVTSFITQGSVLGPFLFLLFVNDFPDRVSSTINLFADATNLYGKIQTSEDRLIQCNSMVQEMAAAL